LMRWERADWEIHSRSAAREKCSAPETRQAVVRKASSCHYVARFPNQYHLVPLKDKFGFGQAGSCSGVKMPCRARLGSYTITGRSPKPHHRLAQQSKP